MNIDTSALRAVATMHHVDPAQVLDAIEDALNVAYQATDQADPDARVTLAEDGTVTIADSAGAVLPVPGFGNVAIATARQAVQTWIKDLERRKVVGPWADREGRTVQATVTGQTRTGDLRLSVEGVNAILPAGEQVLTEELLPGQIVTTLLLAANVDTSGGIRLSLSRRQPALIGQLITENCPEVRAGKVQVVGVVREPGTRSKVALAAVDGTDPITAVVGAGGHRMRQVMAALGAERVDLVRHSTDLAEFAAAALSPAKTVGATVLDETRRKVQVVVPREELVRAEGADGLNLKLANRLTRTKIVLALAD